MMNQEKVKVLWTRVTKGTTSSPYSKMKESSPSYHGKKDLKKQRGEENKNEKTKCSGNESFGKSGKQSEVKKEKKKRKGWKRFRHVALLTCRYIGMGVSHMSPISTYPTVDYTIDPTGWYNSLNRHYPQGYTRSDMQYYWSSGIIHSGW